MLKGIHFLLTYACTSECDHCFLYCSPQAKGTFTLDQIRKVFAQIEKISSVKEVYFEGGEPFLFYPLMVEGVKMAHNQNLNVGLVSNSYWATDPEDAVLWLEPFTRFKLHDLSLSDDLFHHDDKVDNPAKKAYMAACKLNIPVSSICIDEPFVKAAPGEGQQKGEAVIGGGAMFKGRAVEKLTAGLPTRHWREFTSCPHEELEKPSRVHIDAYGNVHMCQGLSMGNMWQTPLAELVENYDAYRHPICSPLLKGGPAQLVREYNITHEEAYVDECHLCYLVRLALLDKFPQFLAPRQVYGLE